jgi:hypothetical protein
LGGCSAKFEGNPKLAKLALATTVASLGKLGYI